MLLQQVVNLLTGRCPIDAKELQNSMHIEHVVESLRFHVFRRFPTGSCHFSCGENVRVASFDKSLATQAGYYLFVKPDSFLEPIELNDIRQVEVGATNQKLRVFGIEDPAGNRNGQEFTEMRLRKLGTRAFQISESGNSDICRMASSGTNAAESESAAVGCRSVNVDQNWFVRSSTFVSPCKGD